MAYTYGGAIDQPLSVVRMGYGDLRDTLTTYGGSTYRVAQPFAIIPLWNSRGQPGLGAFADGTWRKCETAAWSSGSQPTTRCIKINWPELWAGYARPQMFRDFWHGTLLQDKQDGSLHYRRNRYYDPATGRFTQEDPIGLAGGLNLYGFGEGDPVSYSDPYGLCAERRRDAAGLCPGGLSVREWQNVEDAASWMTGSARREILRELNRGNIRKRESAENAVAEVRPWSYAPGIIYFNPNSSYGNPLLSLSPGDLAWVLAHELEHTHQFNHRGPLGALGRMASRWAALFAPRDYESNPFENAANRYACRVVRYRGIFGDRCQ